ncbi:hypothetical protein SAMN02910298_00323 [Pseudobutyrivibrio sp. YE44]|uniref:DUF5717 family protein n=1 Tax=Pseudobutyrivibrio sp. YE44 TaxID=1520802 RepID=UPI0008924C24|nr:DUF5717 family protein [Pseudobutyrivibrio sp. YE44]SDB08304.1 hypothetical protein SAMN02910298_00323 [Pseudobutyrivibrio sp. YE44]
MRKRIYRISEDKFDDLKPNIEFERQQIEETCFVNEPFSGSIYFKSLNDVRIRGVIYCDNAYVKINDPWFDGVSVRIDYSIEDCNFKFGESIEGNFIVVAVGIEKTIPFKISYVHPPLIASVGEIHSLEEYAEFAQNRFPEAVTLFYSDRFSDFIAGLDKRTRLMYRGFKAAPIAPVNVDEFLVSCGLKAKMTFSVDERQDRYFEVTENVKGEIEITRSTWGFIDITVSSDADFVSVEKEHITGDFFLGSIFNMSYYIHRDKMHAGLNYAKISFDYRGIHKEISILATADKEGVTLESEEHIQNKRVLKAFRLYEDFRLRRVSTGQWCASSLEIVESFETEGEPDNFLLLLKAFLYVTNNQKQEALWIIQDLKRTIEDKRSRDWAFLLYICTLIDREEEYVDRLTENIELIFREHSDDPHIFWFLLFLRKEYIKNPTAKLRDISKWVEEGWDSPLLYIEAYYIFVQDPYLITTFNELTIKVLNWAKKKDAITKEFAIQMMHVLETERTFNAKALPILDACYQVYPNEQLLLGIVTYLLKAPYVDESFLKWYQMAIESNLHVSGIFEAYMDALPSYSVEKLPQLVTMFFKYNSNLPYDKKALLYANIILHKDEDYETYEKYESIIEAFSIEQLRLGRLDDNLAVCYQRLMELGIFDNEVARMISELSFKRKLAVINPEIRRVFLYQEEFKAPTIANISDHKAYINYIGSEGVIFLEDNNGFLFVDDQAYFTEEILSTEGYTEKLKELTPLNLTYAMERISSSKASSEYDEEDVKAAELILDSKVISLDYLHRLYPKLIEVLRFKDREALLEQHFMNKADLKALSAGVIAAVLEVFISRSKYDEAYYMMQHTNGSMLKPAVATKLCQYLIDEKPDTPDDFLIILTASLIEKGFVHTNMVRYLIKFFVGPTDTMLRIYDNAFEKGEDVVEFGERILTQSLYRDFLTPDILKVFDTYVSRKNNKMIVEAFLTYEAHDYLANGADIPETIFAYIYNRFKRGQSFNESMRIALLKYLCCLDKLQEDDYDMLDILLADAILRNQYFGFFAKCDRRLKVKYHLYDKHFVEFNAEKRKNLSITYSVNGAAFKTEDMIEMYDGLYVKQFILFYGDELRYQISCEELSEEPLQSKTFVLSDELDEKKGRYALMNSISRHSLYGEVFELAEDVKSYQGLDAVTRELFTTL